MKKSTFCSARIAGILKEFDNGKQPKKLTESKRISLLLKV